MRFESVSIILPTLKETESFVQTVSMILEMNEVTDIAEFVAVVCDRTNPESFKSIEKGREIAETAGVPFSVLNQTRPYFGGAIQDGFDVARGSHVCMVTPDMDTAPDKLPEMIAMAKRYPGDIVIGSRWKKGGGFENYNPVKKIWNYFSQKFLDVLYLTSLSDFTWGNQLAPTVLARAINYKEVKHPINIERVVIPMRLGVGFREIPALCHMSDGETVNPFAANLAYLRPAFRWRFAKRETMVKPGLDWKELVAGIKAEGIEQTGV